MASILERTVAIIFEGDDKTQAAFKGINQALDGIQDAAAPLASLGNSILAIDAALAAVAVSIGLVQEEAAKTGAKLQTSLGLSAEKAGELNDIAMSLFGSNFGESMATNAEVVASAFQRMGDIGGDALEKISANAIAIQDAFGAETVDSLAAAQSIMQDFGISADDAFGFLTAGFQKGLDGSGDFLDSITEYAPQFSSGGASAEQFFSVLETGMQNGALGTDKAADSFKEFRVRILDGSKATSDALNGLGIDSKTFLTGIATGTTTTAEAYGIVLEKLRGTTDQAELMQHGVGLLGTQFEDMGNQAVLSIDLSRTKMDELSKSTEDLNKQYDTFGNDVAGAFRKLTIELANLDVFDSLRDDARAALKEITENLPAAFAAVDFSGATGALDDIAEALKSVFGDIDITSAEGLSKVIQGVVDSIETLIRVTQGMAEPWLPVIGALTEAARAINALDDDTKEWIGNILGVSQQIVIVGGTITGLTAGVKILSSTFSGLGSAASGAMGIAGKAGLLGVAGAAGFAAGDLVRQYVPAVDAGALAVLGWVDSLVDFSGTQGKANQSTKDAEDSIRKEVEAFNTLGESAASAGKTVEEIPNDVSIDVSLAVGGKSEVEQVLDDVEARASAIPIGLTTDEVKAQVDTLVALIEAPAVKPISVVPEIDPRTAEYTRGYLEDIAPDGTRTFTWVGGIDKPSIDKAKQDIEDAVSAEKVLEIEAGIEIAQIEADSEKIKSMLDFKADIDTAEIEAATERITAAFESANTVISSTGDVISSIFSDLSDFMGKDATSSQIRKALVDQLEKENEYRERALELQENLTKAQVEFLEAKKRALESGDALINIDTNGLEPALEMIMWQVIEKVQIRANAEAADFLLGVG